MYKMGLSVGACIMGVAIGELIATVVKAKKISKEDVIATLCMAAVVGIAMSEIL